MMDGKRQWRGRHQRDCSRRISEGGVVHGPRAGAVKGTSVSRLVQPSRSPRDPPSRQTHNLPSTRPPLSRPGVPPRPLPPPSRDRDTLRTHQRTPYDLPKAPTRADAGGSAGASCCPDERGVRRRLGSHRRGRDSSGVRVLGGGGGRGWFCLKRPRNGVASVGNAQEPRRCGAFPNGLFATLGSTLARPLP